MKSRPYYGRDLTGLTPILRSPVAVVVILLSALGAIGIGMQLMLFCADSADERLDYSHLKTQLLIVGVNAGILSIACAIAMVQIYRLNRERWARAAKVRAILFSISAFIVSCAAEGWVHWSFPKSTWSFAIFYWMTVLSFISFCKAIYSALLHPSAQMLTT